MYLIFGGTFNPIHRGHLTWCEKLYHAFDHTPVHLLPCYQPCHKRAPVVSPEHRINMLNLATQSASFCRINLSEINSSQLCYTYETLEKLKPNHPAITLIIGADQWQNWSKWKHTDRILAVANVLILPRKGYTVEGVNPSDIKELINHPHGLINYFNDSIAPWLAELSSTQIRQMLSYDLKQHPGLIPEVSDYIKRYQLYKEYTHVNT